MTKVVESIEGELREILYSAKSREESLEKNWKKLETIFGAKRERLVLITATSLTLNYVLGGLIPIVSYMLCMIAPTIMSYDIFTNEERLNSPKYVKPLLQYWLIFTLWTFIDLTFVSNIPFYYVIKTMFFCRMKPMQAAEVCPEDAQKKAEEAVGDLMKTTTSFFERSKKKFEKVFQSKKA